MGVLALCGTVAAAQQSEKPQVLFSGPPQATSAKASSTLTNGSGKVTNAERSAVIITAWDLEVHLAPRQESMEVHARVTLRNDGTAALSEIPLQLSSTLNFEDADLNGRKLTLTQATIASDADHTGQLHEATIALPQPLFPQMELTLAVDYGGTIPLTAQRLTAIGAPDAAASASDWDRISEDFTGLRGFGDVVWYPVSSLPEALGDGAKLFTEIGRQKLADQGASMAVRVTDEFFGQAPNVALLNGHFVALNPPVSMPTGAFPGVITCSLPATPLGFETPSLFLTRRQVTEANGVRVLATDAAAGDVQDYVTAATRAQPLVQLWLGKQSHGDFNVLDLPETDDSPAETGDLLAIPMGADDATKLAPIVAHGLAHAAFRSPRGWLDEGVANFVGTLWIEATDGRTAALENLNAERTALALAEPANAGDGGEDLLHAMSAVYYRTKATYVLWMLRNLAGNAPLQEALQDYDPIRDATPEYFEHLLEKTSGKDLAWFFENWVYQDRGLPDLSIGNVFTSAEAHQQTMVAIDLNNDGNAEAAAPVTVKGADTEVTNWVRIPARTHMTYHVIFQENPTEVDLNDGTVPEVQDSVHVKKLTTAAPTQ
jgi:hypothetical protein